MEVVRGKRPWPWASLWLGVNQGRSKLRDRDHGPPTGWGEAAVGPRASAKAQVTCDENALLVTTPWVGGWGDPQTKPLCSRSSREAAGAGPAKRTTDLGLLPQILQADSVLCGV